MASNKNVGGKQPLTKEQLKERQRKLAAKRRREMLTERKNVALSNMRNRYNYEEDYTEEVSVSSGSQGGYTGGRGVDHRFAGDLQNMKFCRKPVGFLMSLLFLVAIALVALPFIPISLPAQVTQYTALFAETEPKAATTQAVDDGTEAGNEDEQKTDETAANADDAATAETPAATDETQSKDANAEEGEEAKASTASGTYYGFNDPVAGWFRYVFSKVELNFELPLGDSPWYDEQISKVETGMEDTLAAVLLEAFPAAILLYAIFALAMFIKTFICWASGDRRIYRHTWVECVIMLILSLVVALGGFASTVNMADKMAFGGIVDYLAGLITGKGGFTAGFGLLAMVGLPVIELILSFFLLEKKLRSRDVMQPIIMYDTKRK